MDKVDELVLDGLTGHVLAPERLKELLGKLIQKAAEESQNQKSRIKENRTSLAEVEVRLGRLYQAIETGGIDLDDTLRSRINALKSEKEEHLRLIAMASRRTVDVSAALSPKKIQAFTQAMEGRLKNGDTAFR